MGLASELLQHTLSVCLTHSHERLHSTCAHGYQFQEGLLVPGACVTQTVLGRATCHAGRDCVSCVEMQLRILFTCTCAFSTFILLYF